MRVPIRNVEPARGFVAEDVAEVEEAVREHLETSGRRPLDEVRAVAEVEDRLVLFHPEARPSLMRPATVQSVLMVHSCPPAAPGRCRCRGCRRYRPRRIQPPLGKMEMEVRGRSGAVAV